MNIDFALDVMLRATNTKSECRTPLSVLCVSTNDMQHRLYLHGQYPLLTFPMCTNYEINHSSKYFKTPNGRFPLVVGSNDLAFWLVTTPIVFDTSEEERYSNKNPLSLYHTPFLKCDRYALQQIASLHTSISTHLKTIHKSIPIVADNWRTGLKPLDQKLSPLVTLLRNYGVEVDRTHKQHAAAAPMASSTIKTTTTLAMVIKEYITMGHVTHSSSVANALDQYFTGMQMNDQLLQRMERSLLASIANVETAAVSSLLRPIQALGWQVQELAGLVRFFDTAFNVNVDSASAYNPCNADDNMNGLLDSSSKNISVNELIEASQQLWISAEKLITSIVSGRILIRDFCGWLRHAGSQVKARGTAPNSVQRENARKRRVSQEILERLVTVMNNSHEHENKFVFQSRTGLSENLLKLQVTAMLTETSEVELRNESFESVIHSRSPSPSSVRHRILCQIPFMLPFVQRAFDASKSLFSNPLSNLPNKVSSNEIFLPRTSLDKKCTIAIHSRIGRDASSLSFFWNDDNEDEDIDCNEDTVGRGYFLPKIKYVSNRYGNLSPSSGLENCRQWFLIAQASGDVIQLFCIPLGWKQDAVCRENENSMNFNFESNSPVRIPFYLTTILNVSPTNGDVIGLQFYGDDGKSSVSSGIDSGTGVEEKQMIGFLYKPSSSLPNVEIWTVDYNSLNWQVVPFDSMLLNSSECTCMKTVVSASSVENHECEDFLVARSRIVIDDPSIDFCELLHPRRGVGGILNGVENMISLELFDLEDEECNEDDESD